jgi:hypothetical protein
MIKVKMVKVGDRVRLRPPYGPYIGRETQITRKLDTVDGSDWYAVVIDGQEMIGPAEWFEIIEEVDDVG